MLATLADYVYIIIQRISVFMGYKWYSLIILGFVSKVAIQTINYDANHQRND
jgi:hypothetical protein